MSTIVTDDPLTPTDLGIDADCDLRCGQRLRPDGDIAVSVPLKGTPRTEICEHPAKYLVGEARVIESEMDVLDEELEWTTEIRGYRQLAVFCCGIHKDRAVERFKRFRRDDDRGDAACCPSQGGLVSVNAADTHMDTQLECRCCGQTIIITDTDADTDPDLDFASSSASTPQNRWQYVNENGIDAGGGAYFTHLATCPACITRTTDGAVRDAREAGLVACPHPDHGSHMPGSEAFTACREAGYLPLSDAEYERVMEAYHAARERCCPACGRAGSLNETTVEYQGFALDGATCVCGWTGREKDLSYRKPTDSRNAEEAENT